MPEPADNRTLGQLAAEALVVQDACNLSGVVHSWSRSISRLRQLLPYAGTDEINGHSINILFASKVASLTNCESGLVFSTAYDQCSLLHNREP